MRALAPLLACVAVPCAAHAQSCTTSFSDMNFGTVDMTSTATYTTTGAFTATCTGGPNRNIYLCIYLGSGSGGGESPRFMTNGASQMGYDLYSNGIYTTIWGTGGAGVPLNIVTDAAGNGSGSRTVFGRTSAPTSTLPTGNYVSSFAGHATVQWNYLILAGTCDAFNPAGTAQPSFTVTATYNPICRVSATPLSFGSAGVLASALDATSSLSVACSIGTPYTVGLSVGTGAGATTAVRKMTGAGGKTVAYTLYRDAARTQLWGATIGTDAAAGTGTGSAQTMTVYGRVPAQVAPAPANYSDTINVTVTY